MYLTTYKTQVTVWSRIKGLLYATLEAVRGILFVAVIILPLLAPLVWAGEYVIKQKTSDKEFCPRLKIQDPTVRWDKYHCPPIKTLVIK